MEQPARLELVIEQAQAVEGHAQTPVAAAFAGAVFALKSGQRVSIWLPSDSSEGERGE